MIRQLTPAQANDLMARGDVDVIDVRGSDEWASGHLPGARHVPFERFRVNPDAFISRDAVIFVCAAGIRSEAAARVAGARGFQQVYNLSGGTRAWARAGLPLARAASAA